MRIEIADGLAGAKTFPDHTVCSRLGISIGNVSRLAHAFSVFVTILACRKTRRLWVHAGGVPVEASVTGRQECCGRSRKPPPSKMDPTAVGANTTGAPTE